MENPPEKSARRELVQKSVEGAVGMVPIVGSPVAVAFALAMGWSYNKRMQLWFEDVAEAIRELQAATEDWPAFEDLAEDDVFVDAVVHASRAAQATHQEEKLRALRNGVQTRYVRWRDRQHLQDRLPAQFGELLAATVWFADPLLDTTTVPDTATWDPATRDWSP